MPDIVRNGVTIDDNFAEAFPMSGTGILITAPNAKWARQAALTMTGFATSVIGCGCEAGIDREVSPQETPDGRPRRSRAALRHVVEGRGEATRQPASANAC